MGINKALEQSMKKFVAILISLSPGWACAADWSNCIAAPSAEAVEEELRKATSNVENGPNSFLPSRQIFTNGYVLCQEGSELSAIEWQKAAEAINPVRSVKSFKPISTAYEFERFLKAVGLKAEDQDRLSDKISAYLNSRSQMPAILIGFSQANAVIVLGSWDHNQRLASIMQITL